jgi:large repetitive protein
MINYKKIVLPFVLFLGLTCYGQVFIADTLEACDSVTVKFTYNDSGAYVATSWQWDFGNDSVSTIENPIVKYVEHGLYTVKLITNNTDTLTKTNYIKVRATPSAYFYPTDSFSFGSQSVSFVITPPILVDTTVKITYEIIFGDGNKLIDTNLKILHYYKKPGIYEVKLLAKDNFGCKSAYTKSIELLDQFDLSNVFSPNNDGINDYFRVESNGIDDINFQVFNSLGVKVYEKTARVIFWDGRTLGGKELKDGMYFYVVERADGIKKNGFVYLYR